MRIELELGVQCTDGPCGTVGDVAIDPQRRVVTHIVVEPHHNHHVARLVPIGDVTTQGSNAAVRLKYSTVALERYPEVEDTAFVRLGEWPPLQDDTWEVGVSTVLAVPALDTGLEGGTYIPMPCPEGAYVSYDRIPAGEVELRRGSPVEAADGRTVGHVDGLVVDDEGRITHLFLRRGHLWGRKQLTVPVAAVKQLRTDAVELELAVDDVVGLPSVPVWRHQRRPTATS